MTATTLIGGPTYTAGGSMPQVQFGVSGQELYSSSSGIASGGMRGAGLIALMLSQIFLQRKIISLSRDYYDTNKKDYDFFRNTHRPHVEGSASEAFSGRNPHPGDSPDYVAVETSGLATSKEVDKAWYEVRRRLPRYAVGLHRRTDYDFAFQRAHAGIVGWSISRRYADAYYDSRVDRYFNRKFAVANIGIAAGNLSAQGLATATTRLIGSYESFTDNLASIGNGFFAKKGTQQGAEDTRQRMNKFTGVEM